MEIKNWFDCAPYENFVILKTFFDYLTTDEKPKFKLITNDNIQNLTKEFSEKNSLIELAKKQPIKEVDIMPIKLKQGTIRYRKNQKLWEARYYVNGKQKSIYAKKQADCINKLKEAIKEKKELSKYNKTLKHWFEQWLEIYKKPKLKKSSIESIEITFKKYILPDLANILLNKLSALQIQKTLNKIPFQRQKEITKKNLNNCLEKAYRIKLIKDNPMTAVEIETSKSEQWRPLTIEQQNQFLNAIKGHKYEPLFLFYLHTGARRNEALQCKWKDIDFENRIITLYSTKIEKKGQERKIKRFIHMSNKMYKVLKSIPKIENNEFIFHDMKNVNKAFQKIREKLKFDNKIVIQSLRKTFATRCYENDVPIKVIQAMLGHSKPNTTEKYYISVLPTWQAQYNQIIDKLYP